MSKKGKKKKNDDPTVLNVFEKIAALQGAQDDLEKLVGAQKAITEDQMLTQK